MLHLVGSLHYLYQWCTVKQISDNEIYLLIKYIKSVLWRRAKRLSYTEDARCLKVNIYIYTVLSVYNFFLMWKRISSYEVYNFSYINFYKRPDYTWQLKPKHVAVKKNDKTSVLCDWFDTYTPDGYVTTRFNICPYVLLIVTANAIWSEIVFCTFRRES